MDDAAILSTARGQHLWLNVCRAEGDLTEHLDFMFNPGGDQQGVSAWHYPGTKVGSRPHSTGLRKQKLDPGMSVEVGARAGLVIL